MVDPDDKTRELDHAFEQALLGSALEDAPPRGASSVAWLRFAGSMAAATALYAGDKLPAAAAGAKLGAAAAAKWLIVGAIAGSSVTAALMLAARAQDPAPAAVGNAQHRTEPVGSHVSVTRPEAAPPGSAAENRTAPPLGSKVPFEVPRRPGPRVADESSHAARSSRSAGPASSAPAGTGDPRAQRSSAVEHATTTGSSDDTRRSTLAAQVALIDAARTANSVGAADDALRLIEKYRREFPKGELAADAEVVAIEALGSKGDSRAAVRQARRFLTRYPNDPHTGYVTGVAASAQEPAPQGKAPPGR